MSAKYIFVTGGVVSGIGKGITAASLGRLLKARGLKVTMQKCDPYINVDPGTMSPYQHGEVFVTDDGTETDLDLGHYERFIDESLTAYSSVTAGKIYWSVLSRERRGDYLGRTVQVIPHITDEIKNTVYKLGNSGATDIVITEVGGTVGDIESLPFIESIRQIAVEVGRENCLFVHVTLVPYLGKSGELKSKPTQHSVKGLLEQGIQPDIIVCRTEHAMPKEIRDKLALFCNVPADCIIENLDSESLYDVPLMLEREGLAKVVCRKLALECHAPDLKEWEEMVVRHKHAVNSVKISLVGKYVSLHDAYISVVESLVHAGIAHDTTVEIDWVDSDKLNEENYKDILKESQGIVVPGGFGDRGIDGKILAARYARENKVPFLGICLGMQMAVVEFARNVLKMKDAHSSELDPDTKHPVIDLMEAQKDVEEKGGTMRLGQYACNIRDNTKTLQLYGRKSISERHRHRYEFNNEYREKFEEAGMAMVGLSPDETLVEIVELTEHPWFVGVQFHPEYKSRPNRAHPLFSGFIEAALEP